MTETQETNTCPKCGASILVKSTFSVVTCSYCQSKFSLQQITTTKASTPEALPSQPSKPKKQHPLFKRFYLAMGLSMFCACLLLVFIVRIERSPKGSTEYVLNMVGILLSLLASPGLIIYAIVVLVQIGMNPVKDES